MLARRFLINCSCHAEILHRATFSASTRLACDNQQSQTPLVPPKRPGTAFAMFLKENHPSFSLEHPHLKAKEVMKMLSNKWNNLPEFEKHQFKERYAELREKFDKEMQYFSDSLSDAERKAYSKGKKSKVKLSKRIADPRKPKSPQSVFQVFMKDALRSHRYANVSGPQLFKSIGADWRDLDDDEREVYERRFSKLKEEYEDAMKLYEATVAEERERNM